MSSAALPTIPQLDPPGAGLPWLELRIARLLFGWSRRRTSRSQASAVLERERQLVLALSEACPDEKALRPILIDRLPGMEDSSRFWSVYMTVDHLRIVNLSISGVIQALGQGMVPDRVASTAAVKPDPAASRPVLAEFDRTCKEIVKTVDSLADLHTSSRYAHPWFGPLDAAGWHFLAGFHLTLHRRQLEAILKKL